MFNSTQASYSLAVTQIDEKQIHRSGSAQDFTPSLRIILHRSNYYSQLEEEEEERTLTYAELHPLREPKWLTDRDKRGAADKFLKKVSNEEDRHRARKKKQARALIPVP